MKRVKAIITGLFLPVVITAAQQFDPFAGISIEEAVENAAENIGEEADISSLTEELETCLMNPINLNTANSEQLKQLHILNDFQLASLIEYRKRGPILSLYELLYIPGFSEEEVKMLLPFVACREPPPKSSSFRQIRNRASHQILLRYQRIIEQQEGYVSLPDSILETNPDKSHYLGNPDKVYLRYKLDAADIIRAGIVMEKDAGEEIFQGSNPQGFDFHSAYLLYQSNKRRLRQLCLGDFHVQLGQGVLMWSSYAFGKSSSLSGLSRSGSLIKGNSSVDENRFLRGASLRFGKGDFTFMSFVSSKFIDASPVDSNIHKNAFSGRVTTGLHNTPLSLRNEDQLKEQIMGASLRYDQNRLHLGINGIYQQFNKYCIEQDQLYESFYFTGYKNFGFSFDYRYLAGKMQFFGESAYSNSAFACLNGALFFIHSGITIGILHRHYQISYSSFWADAFREGSRVGNEEGLYLGGDVQFGRNKLKIYADIFSFPWLRYRVNAPSQGYEVAGSWETQIGMLKLFFRYKREGKGMSDESYASTFGISKQLKQQYKLRLHRPINERLILQGRLEAVQDGKLMDTLTAGYFFSQDLIFIPANNRLELSGRIAWFHAEEYATRIYVYERDVLYSGGSKMHYGKGWRFSFLAKWQLSAKISLWCKLSRNCYPGEEEIGSGLNKITARHRTELKLQFMIKL